MSDAAARRLRSAVDRDARVLTAFLALLVAREHGGLLEVRTRRAEGGMLQRFYRAGRLRVAADELLELGARTDVYVGCVPRVRLAGDRSALGAAWVLWVDCDDAGSVARLAAFVPVPAVVVRSGTASNVHAYWPLVRPLAPDAATVANRRLAEVLGGDARSADATRILRAPGTRNFKHEPPRAVVLERFEPARRFTVAELVGTTTMSGSMSAAAASSALRASAVDDDRLRRIPPGIYVPALTGRSVGVTARSVARFMRTARRRCTSTSARSRAGTASVAGVVVRSTTWPPSSMVSRRGVDGSFVCAFCCSSASRSGRRRRRSDANRVIGVRQAGLRGGAGIASVFADDRRGRLGASTRKGSPRLRLGSALPVPGVVVLVRAIHTTKEAPVATSNINRVVLTGNLTADPELRPLPSGTSVCRLRVAVNTRRKDSASGEYVDKPNYFDVVVWGAQGEACARYLAKGRPVAIDGHLEWRERQVEGGAKRQAVEVIADVVQFLGGNRREGDDARQAAAVPGETS
jgi:single-strand DNA-binding protein